MRTYVPYADFDKCAACFSDKRLTKQRHDALYILYMLHDIPHPTFGRNGFYNSPPKKCWQQYPGALIRYGRAMCEEWSRRNGKPDPCLERFNKYAKHYRLSEMPCWINDEQMHKSHQAILARQEPERYPDFKADPADEKVFYWPSVDVEMMESRRTNPHSRDNCRDEDCPPDCSVEDCECDACEYARDVYES